ncbi:MAG: hypothetical protein RQ847_02685, partial [Wenzhouxiangellaceae bacterium]|nr:hypothetical protein [Wenzhouxiangellaceae bacterium]
MKRNKPEGGGMDRREFMTSMGIGATGLGVASTGLLMPLGNLAAMPGGHAGPASGRFPGLQPAGAAQIAQFPTYNGPWTQLPNNPFGGFDFALCYMA